jgi:hypothetical protein
MMSKWISQKELQTEPPPCSLKPTKHNLLLR